MTWGSTNHKHFNTMNEGFIKKLMSTIKCGVCGKHYEISNIEVLGHEDNVWFLNAACPACHNKALVAAIIKENKSLEVITDLTQPELTRFATASAVSTDDILDLHSFLNEFDGNFIELFAKK